MIYWYVAFVCALIYAYLALSVLVLENGGRRWGPEKTWGGILAAPLLVDLLYLPPCSIARNVPVTRRSSGESCCASAYLWQVVARNSDQRP